MAKSAVLPSGWKTVKLSEIADKCKAKNRDFKYSLVLTNSAQHGVIPQSEHFDKDIAVDENIDGYSVIRDGEFVYNPRISVTAPCGPIRRNHLGTTGVMSPLYTVFKLKEGKIDSEYAEYYFLSSAWHKYAKSVANYGARFDRMAIFDNDFFSMPILVPPLAEQRHIAEILAVQDSIIALKQRMIDAKKPQKRWLMQNLLWHKTWKAVRFKTMFDRLMRKNTVGNTNVLTISAWQGLINQEEYFSKSVSSEDLSGYFLLYRGEFAYNKSYSGNYKFGAFKRLDRYESGVVSPLYICFTPSAKNKYPEFYMHYFESSLLDREIKAFAQEGARNHGLLNISVDDFFSMKIPIPPLEEQVRIAERLTAADREIELLTQELEQQKLVKKHLMQHLLTGKMRVKEARAI
jgi:type I restriction enzyme S subunit